MNASPLIVAEGLQADGLLVQGYAPLGTLWVPLRSGLTVIYGRNGAGKTRLLDAIASAMTGVRLSAGTSSVHLSFTDDLDGWQPHLIETLGDPDNFAIDAVPTRFSAKEDPISLGKSDRSGEDEHDDGVTEGALARARAYVTAIAELHGLTDGLCHSPRIALVSEGDVDYPMWTVGVSVVPTGVLTFNEAHPTTPVFVDSGGNPLPVIVGHLPVGDGGFGDWRDDGLGARGEIACLVADDATDIDALTLRQLQLEVSGGGDLLLREEDGGFRLADAVSSHAGLLSRSASSIVNTLAGRPLSLRCKVLNPNSWLSRQPVLWTAIDDQGVEIPIASLGSGLARWSRLAISIALNGGDMLRPAVVIVDEPERALHSAAQRDTAEAFQNALDEQQLLGVSLHAAIVATHSPAFLALPDAHLVHVARGTNGDVELKDLDTTVGVEALTADLGITRSDALLTIRTFLFVEGEHELAVLSAIFGEAMQRRHIVMLPMRGAANIGGYVTAQNLLTYSDATIRVVVDRMGIQAEEKWNEARAAFADGDRNAASRAVHKLEGMRGDRFNWLFDAARAGLECGYLDRIELVVLDEVDIIKYLPVAEFVPGAESWEELDQEYAQLKHPRPVYKAWLKQSKGATVSGPRLNEIAYRCEPTGDISRAIENL